MVGLTHRYSPRLAWDGSQPSRLRRSAAPNSPFVPEGRPKLPICATAARLGHVYGVGDGFPLAARAVFRSQPASGAKGPLPTPRLRHGAKALARRGSWGRIPPRRTGRFPSPTRTWRQRVAPNSPLAPRRQELGANRGLGAIIGDFYSRDPGVSILLDWPPLWCQKKRLVTSTP